MIGQELSHYRFTGRISEGGMGTVYTAEDFVLGRTVAVKMVKPSHQDPEIANRRFLREAQAISQIHHPNVVTIHEVIQKGDANFLIMQYIDGHSLRVLLERERIEPRRAFRIASDVAAGLEAAHRVGVVHRDIKPENIMIDSSGRAVVLDFGIAHLVDRSTLTRKGRILGTLRYMAPESVKGKPVDARSDIYSLGVVLYEMLAGAVPLDDKDEAALFFKIDNVDPPPVSRRNRGLPRCVDNVLGRALAKDPALRHRTAEDLRMEIERIRPKLPREIGSPSRGSSMRKRWIVGSLGLVIAILATLLLWRVFGSG